MVDPRWRTVVTVTPYVVLGLLIAFLLSAQWGDWARVVPALVLCAVFAAWMTIGLIMLSRPPSRPPDRAVMTAVFMAGLVALTLVLVLFDSWFGFLTIAVYPFAYGIVPWPWELLAVGATAVVGGIAQSSGFGRDPAGYVGTAAVIALNVAVMCGLSWGLQLSRRQQEQEVTEVERSRLAREIHDTLAQGFAGIVTQLQAAEQAPDEESRKRHSDAALVLARDGLAEARRSVQALRPVALDAVRLTGALENVAHAWSVRTGIPVKVAISGEGRALSTDAEVALLRTVQEALANVEHHAHAHRVVLTLRSDAAGTRLEVRDDGRGFDPAERAVQQPRPEDGGYGLVAMRERLESVAGALVVESRPGHGTAVRAEVPA